LAKKALVSDKELARARILRLQQTKDNRSRSRAKIASIAMKYRDIKNAYLDGLIEKPSFEHAYNMTGRLISESQTQFVLK